MSFDVCNRSSTAPERFLSCPLALDFNLLQREALGHAIAEARRAHPELTIHHDDVDPTHPLVVQALADQVARAIPDNARSPQHIGLILAASGHGDAGSRANSYRLMRLMWEQLGLGAGEVGFVRHAQPFLAHTLEKCAPRPFDWIVLPEAQWKTEHVEFAAVILENFQRAASGSRSVAHGGAAGRSSGARLRGSRNASRVYGAKNVRANRCEYLRRNKALPPGPGVVEHRCWDNRIGARSCRNVLSPRTDSCLRGSPSACSSKSPGTATRPERTRTRPRSIFCSALSPRLRSFWKATRAAEILKRRAFNWETEARENRAWIRQQDAEYLTPHRSRRRPNQIPRRSTSTSPRPTGTAHAIEINIPEVLLQYAGCPMISFAKFKGPTRLAISNLFGLDSRSVALCLARAEHHLLRASLLRPRQTVRRAVPAVRHQRGSISRPCDGTARAFTAAAGATTI